MNTTIINLNKDYQALRNIYDKLEELDTEIYCSTLGYDYTTQVKSIMRDVNNKINDIEVECRKMFTIQRKFDLIPKGGEFTLIEYHKRLYRRNNLTGEIVETSKPEFVEPY